VKVLLLLRHAKSDWGEPGLSDHDRPLNARGERAAELIAGYIAKNCPRADLILCSTAVRARQTLAPLIHRLSLPAPPIALESGLYLASEDTLLERVRNLPDDKGTVLLIGHNDGIGELAAALPGRGEAAALQAVRQKFPTGALAVFRSRPQPWRSLSPGACDLLTFVRPRELAGR
jgi:phosphohistidine phosphatase